MDKKYYKPLPEYLTIKPSSIEGLGLFAVDNIDANFRMGVTHVKDVRFADGYIRTPLGAWINHSETPNCEFFYDGDFVCFRTIKEIKCGEELLATYLWYDPSK